MATDNLISALLNTGVIIAIIPVLGIIVDLVQKTITKGIAGILGGKAANVIVNKVTFIGVIHHELSHALMALVTGAKITEANLFKPDKNSGTLGNVKYVPRGNKLVQSIQMTFSSVAPVPCGIISSMLIVKYAISKCEIYWQYIIVIYLLVSIILHMNLSKQDIKVALKGSPVLCIAVFIIVLLTKFDSINFLKGILNA